jgi:hypothetical protein
MVTITGTQQATQTAQLLIHSKLEQALATSEVQAPSHSFSPSSVGLQLGGHHILQPGRELHQNQWL